MSIKSRIKQKQTNQLGPTLEPVLGNSIKLMTNKTTKPCDLALIEHLTIDWLAIEQSCLSELNMSADQVKAELIRLFESGAPRPTGALGNLFTLLQDTGTGNT